MTDVEVGSSAIHLGYDDRVNDGEKHKTRSKKKEGSYKGPLIEQRSGGGEESRPSRSEPIFRGEKSLYTQPLAAGIEIQPDEGGFAPMDLDNDEANDEDEDILSEISDVNMEDLRDQEQLYEQGRRNATTAQANGELLLPKDILKLYKKVYPVILGWWREGVSGQSTIDSVNKEIKKRNARRNEKSELYQFPTSLLISLIERIKEGLAELDGKSGVDRAPEVIQMVNRVTEAITILENKGIPTRALIPYDFQRKLEEVFKEAESLSQGCGVTGQHYLRYPVKAQEILLERGIAMISEYLDARKSNEHGKARETFKEIRTINSDLTILNTELGLDPNDHHIPIKDLEQLNEAPALKAKKLLLRLQAHLRMHGFPSLAQDIAEAPVNKSSQHSPVSGQMSRNKNSIPNSNGSLRTRSDAAEYIDTGFEVPSYADGFTHLGKVVGIKKLALGYRVIVNAGTEAKPHYSIYPGSEFGKTAASELYKNGLQLKGPSVPLRNREPGHISSIRYYVRVNHDSDSAPSYFLVEYKRGEENPYSDKPLDEWLTMSELSSICGSKIVKHVFMPKCMAKWEANQRFLEEMKLNNQHPDTKKQLTRIDKIKSPWLFPLDDTSGIGGIDSGSNADSDSDGGSGTRKRTKGSSIHIDDEIYD